MGMKNGKRLICVLLLCTFIIFALLYTFLTRFYVSAYYVSAHAAAMAIIPAFSALCHTCACRKFTSQPSHVIRCATSTLYVICFLVAVCGYITITSLAINRNYDYISAVIWALAALTISVCGLWRDCLNTKHKVDAYDLDHEMAPYNSDDGGSNRPGLRRDSSKLSVYNSTDPVITPTHKTTTMSCACCALIVYVIINIVILFFVAVSAFYPCVVTSDVMRYREDDAMKTVKVGDHYPLALFIKCFGNGSDTIVLENGFAGLAYINVPFLVHFLSSNHTICIYDRRGNGWSETYESDNLNLFSEPQYSKTNVEFLQKVIEKSLSQANIKTPFYYAGHSYGGHHLVYMALLYPDLVKGLIFIDSSYFGGLLDPNIDETGTLLKLLANLLPTGLVHFVIRSGLLDYESQISQFIDFSQIPDNTKQIVLAQMLSGSYFATYTREQYLIYGRSHDELTQLLVNKTINKSVLQIDAGYAYGSSWLPKKSFPLFNDTTDLHGLPGASHTSIIFSRYYAEITSKIIDDFIQRSKARLS